MAYSQPNPILLREPVKKEDVHHVVIKSFDQRRPKICEIGASLDSIRKFAVADDSVVNVYPRRHRTNQELKLTLSRHIEQISTSGLAYMTDNLSVSANLTTESQPDKVLFDVCLLVDGTPPTVLSVVRQDHVDNQCVVLYNLTLARGVVQAVRSFTSEQFSVVYGVITDEQLNSQETFQDALVNIKQKTSASCVRGSLKLKKAKRQQIIQALLSSIALTTSVDDKDNSLWFLTLDQFVILTENIDQGEVNVRTAPSSGGKVLMREVARRLERSGPTLLVMESEEQIKVAGKQKTCSFMMTVEEWKTAKNEVLEGLTNMVTNCQDCIPPPGITGRSWIFAAGQDLKRVEDSDGETAEELEASESNQMDTTATISGTSQDNLSQSVRELGEGREKTAEKTKQLVQKITQCQSPAKTKDTTYDDPQKIIQKLRNDLETMNIENSELKSEITQLKQTEEEFSRMLDKVSLGGRSLDSDYGSYTRSQASFGGLSVSSVDIRTDPKGATGGERGAMNLLKRMKKTLTFERSKGEIETIAEEWEKFASLDPLLPIYVPAENPLYVLSDGKRSNPVSLLCAHHEMDKERANTRYCHVTVDGRLVNTKPTNHIPQGMRRFKLFLGTCSASPFHLPSTQSALTPVPPAPQYWETETAVGMETEWYRLTVMEIGVVEEDMVDSGVMLYERPRSCCVRVGWCHTHKGYCTQVWNQGKRVKCVRDSMSNTPGTSHTLRYGVVVDIVRGRVGFVDVDKGVVLEKMDVEFTQTIYPVFGVWPNPDDFTVEIRLISGSDVTMTEDKQKLIYSCLT